MTIRPRRDWGEASTVPAEAVTVASDHDAAGVLDDARQRGTPPPPLILRGGDLARTLGLRTGTEVTVGDPCRVVTVDRGVVLVDGEIRYFVAHLVARRGWWRGPVVAVMNAQFLGRWDVAPRSHPGDGRLVVLEADPSLPDRWKARGRLRSGTHVPHPDITVRRITAEQFTLPRGTSVWIDGHRLGQARHLSVRVEADAVPIVVPRIGDG